MTATPRHSRLEHARPLAALLFAVFVVALGTGFILPILPSMIERLAGTSEPAVIARHTAFLTSIFSVAPLAVALPWGRLSDDYGRRPILLFGLAGFAVTLAASALALSLPFLYVARLLNGGFAAAVVPAALAFVADTATDEHRRARTFGWISVATSLGLLAGPVLGGLTPGAGGGATALNGETLPFLLVAGVAFVAAAAVWSFVKHGAAPMQRNGGARRAMAPIVPGEIRLLVLAALAAGGLGAFEVGLTLRSRDLAMTPAALGLMFAGCMLLMLVVQGIAFSPLVRPATTRWFIAPSLVVMGVGLALIPSAAGAAGLLAATGMVAASGGLLTPLLAYWLSRISGRGQGAELGLQTAAVSLGLSLGAVGPGALSGVTALPGASFVLAAAVLAAAVASLRLPADLVRGTHTDEAGLIHVTEERS